MKHLAEVYGRALFPSRYRTHADGSGADAQFGALALEGLDLTIAGGVYRLVSAVEGLLRGIRQRIRTRPAQVRRAPVTSPVGCG